MGTTDPSLVDRLFWDRHASPASVWTAVAAYPTLIVAIYRRDGRLLTGVLLTVAAHPLFVSPPETDDAWATRVVLGERAWLDRGVTSSVPDLLFTVACAPIQLYTFRSAARQRPIRTAVGTLVSMVLLFVFFHRMVQIYEREGDP